MHAAELQTIQAETAVVKRVQFQQRKQRFNAERTRLDDFAEFEAKEEGWVRRTLKPEDWKERRRRAGAAAAAAAAVAQRCTVSAISVV